MNCEQVQSLVVSYLDGEVTPSERILIQAHLSGCTVCQQEFESAVYSSKPSSFGAAASRDPGCSLAGGVESARGKTDEGRATFAEVKAWLSRKAPNAGRASNQFFGGVKMQKRWIFSGLAGVIALSVLAIFVAQTATPVSARQILDRAYEVQFTQTEGISNIIISRSTTTSVPAQKVEQQRSFQKVILTPSPGISVL